MNFFILADLKKLITILFLFISLFGVTQNYNEEYIKSQEYLNKSMPDLAISKLYSILEKGTLTNSFKDSVILLLAEGYRQKRNFDNGIEVLKELLNKKPNNEFVKAKAYNRIAALYDEWLAFGENRLDSTLKYSNLCLNIASKNNFTDMVASSLNEIGFVYLKQKKYNIARRILIKSYNKFLDLNQYLYATNVALNISNTYVKQELFNNAIEILDSAANKINKKEYINMFMRVYLQKANIYEKQGKYDSAYKY
jgi:tetratricopeptide (TPR) repeat protein